LATRLASETRHDLIKLNYKLKEIKTVKIPNSKALFRLSKLKPLQLESLLLKLTGPAGCPTLHSPGQLCYCKPLTAWLMCYTCDYCSLASSMLVNLKVRIKYIFASNAISYAAGTLVLLRAQDVYSEAFYLVLLIFS
jgi:hypothetical protein